MNNGRRTATGGMKFGMAVWKAKVVRLHGMDNNGCTLRLANGKEMKGVCEWCKIIKKVEDQ